MANITQTLSDMWGNDETIVVHTKNFLESAILLADAFDEELCSEEFVDDVVLTKLYQL